MASRQPAKTSKRLLGGALIFGLFILFDIALFAYLIFSSLSQREIERVLLETREQVEPIAERLAAQAAEGEGKELWVLVSRAEETRTYIDGVFDRRDLVQTVEIRDRSGKVIYSKSEKAPLEGVVQRPSPRANSLQSLELPIGDYGTLVVGLSDEEVQRRIGALRGDLTRQASLIGVLTVFLLCAALAAFIVLTGRARRLEEQAEEAERMAYVGTLASGLAHEIRSPLNSLSLNMQLLEEEARGQAGTGSQLRLLALTRSELKRLERLATDFLSYARPRALEKRLIPPGKLLARVLEVLRAELQARGIQAELRDSSEGATISGDENLLTQLLLNLANNAIAALEARAEDGPNEPKNLRLSARRDNGDVILEVIDNGEGMSAEVRERMFELFFSNRKGGTGLGLAIVQRIAEAHEARIEVESEPERGTTVRLRFAARTGVNRGLRPPARRSPPGS